MEDGPASVEAVQIAETIRAQIGRIALAMIGAQHFIATGTGIRFRVRGSQAGNLIQIDLNAHDLYDVTLYRAHGLGCTEVSCETEMYFDQLAASIGRLTGLATKL